MNKKPKAGDFIGLRSKEINFVIEYCKDFDARRAAEASGYSADSGYAVRDKDNIQAAVAYVLDSRLETSHIDAEWVLMETVENHLIARQKGNISASNTALGLIMKHTLVDAVASDKLNMNIHADKDIMERLQRGRQRLLERDGDNDEPEEVSFM